MNATQSLSQNLGVDVAMRVTYVTVDRSGWFEPSLFDMSKSFMRATEDANYATWSAWNDGHTAKEAVMAIQENSSSDKPKGYLAAFTVGYILVKHCVIKITQSSADTKSFKSHFDRQSER